MATAWIVFESEREVRAPAVNTTSFINESINGVSLDHNLRTQTNPIPSYDQSTNRDDTLSGDLVDLAYAPQIVAETAANAPHKDNLAGLILEARQTPVNADDGRLNVAEVDSFGDVNVVHSSQVYDGDIQNVARVAVNSTAYVESASKSRDLVDHSKWNRPVEDTTACLLHVQQCLDRDDIQCVTPTGRNNVNNELLNPHKIEGMHTGDDNFEDIFSQEVDSTARCLSLPTSPLATSDKQWLEYTNDPLVDKSNANIKCSSSLQNIDIPAPLLDHFGESTIHAKLCKTVSDGAPLAPPIPPRDYAPRVIDRSAPRRIEIHPVVQNGQKRSSTHYWLLPDKQRIFPTDSSKKSPEFYMNVPEPCFSRSAPVAEHVSDKNRGCYGPADIRGETSTGRQGREFRHGAWTDSTLYLLADEADMDTRSVDLPFAETVVENVVKKTPPPSSNKSIICHSEGGVTFSSCSSSKATSMSEVKDMIDRLQLEVGGVTYDESYTALVTNHWNYDEACKYLKVEHLFCLAIANRSICRSMLERNDWDIELAASSMLDLTRSSCGKSPLRSPNFGQISSQKGDPRQPDGRMNRDVLLSAPHTSRTAISAMASEENERKPSLSPRTRPLIETKENFTFEPSDSPRSANR